MEIRKASENDLNSIKDMTEKNFEFIVGLDKWEMMRMGDNYKEIATQKYLEELDKNNGITLVAEIDGKIIGCGMAVPLSKSALAAEKYKDKYLKAGVINNVFVEKEYRGRGIGSEIITELEKYLKSRGCSNVRLDVFAPNPARTVYEKLGYDDYARVMLKKI